MATTTTITSPKYAGSVAGAIIGAAFNTFKRYWDAPWVPLGALWLPFGCPWVAVGCSEDRSCKQLCVSPTPTACFC